MAYPASTVQDEANQPIAPDTPPAPGSDGSLRELFTDNLFKDAKNSVLTVLFGAIIAWAAFNAVTFAFFNTKVIDGVERLGWEIVRDNLRVYMLGPNFGLTGTSLTSVWTGVFCLAAAFGGAAALLHDDDAPPMLRRTRIGLIGAPTIGVLAVLSFTRTITPSLLTVATVVIGYAVYWLVRRLPEQLGGRVGTGLLVLLVLAFAFWSGFSLDNFNDFGGVMLTISVSIICIIACFPIGIVMALARRSSFPLIRPIAVGYIEFIRGVPLISLLFIGQFALGFLLPAGFEQPGEILRAMVMITLFSAAYVAEIVRGGLQSVPKGQTEGGQAVGLSPLTITRRIVLPQALRNSIPPLIGQFISLLKDTTLLFIIGQRELLGVVPPLTQAPEYRFQGFTPEAYAFCALIFWSICFSMSRMSQRLETRLGVGTR